MSVADVRLLTTDMDWINIFNRLFALIDVQGDNYFSGPRFIHQVRRLDRYHADYYQLMAARRRELKSTTRRDYFLDLLMNFSESDRAKLVSNILSELDESANEGAAEIRGILSGAVPGPSATVPSGGWNAERLNDYLAEIDASLAAGNDERAVTLAYTCLEGFYKAFASTRLPEERSADLVSLARVIKRYVKDTHGSYPDDVLNMITHASHAVDRARNRFSESHFDEEAEHWLAVYIRDLVNTQIRLLLHFL